MQPESTWSSDDATVQEIVTAMQGSKEEGPGSYLKQLREHMNLSEMEMASQLNIGIHQIRALEADDYDNLPAPIFVRNFLRRYAEFLQIPVDVVIDSYERYGEIDQPTLSRVSLRERIHTRQASMRWATYTAAGLLVAILVYWWQTGGNGANNNAATDTAAEMGLEGEQILLLPQDEGDDAIVQELGIANSETTE
jgi:hypothetical protein